MDGHLSSLSAFLKASRAAVMSRDQGLVDQCKRAGEPCHVFVGNEAADCDSVVSAVALAYHRACQGEGLRALPLVNTSRQDLPLRLEIPFLFDKLGLDIADLVCIDEIDLPALHAQNQLELTLVDHNRLSSAMGPLASCVVEVIDHHKDEGCYQWAKKTMAGTASCSTVVGDILLDEQPQLFTGDGTLARLLVNTILLDSIGLDWDKGLVTQRDVDVVERLRPFVEPLSANETFAEIHRAKFAMGHLTAEQLLRKDYKGLGLAVPAGISSIGLSLDDFKSDKLSGQDNAIANFMAQQAITLLAVMAVFTDKEGRFRRQIGVWSGNKTLFEYVTRELAANQNLSLSVINDDNRHEADGMGDLSAVFFEQGNIKASRKVVLPFLASLFQADWSTAAEKDQ